MIFEYGHMMNASMIARSTIIITEDIVILVDESTVLQEGPAYNIHAN